MKRLEVIEDIKEPIEESTVVIANKVYKPTRKVLKLAKKGEKPLKSGLKKANPFAKEIDKNNTTETGVESIRFGYQVAKKSEKAVKTTKATVKTTVKAVKTVPKVTSAVTHPKKTVVKVVKNTGQKIKKTINTTVTAVKTVAKVGYTAVAVASNPYVLIALAVIVVIMLTVNTFAMLLGGASGEAVAVAEPIALSDMYDQYEDALDYYDKAVSDRKQYYYDMIDSLKFYNNNDEIKNSNLVSAEFHTTGNRREFSKYYATDENRYKLKNEWDYQIADSEKNKLIAIAYCYKEKKLNEENETELELYEFDFDQDLFDELLEKIVPLEETITEHQECPDRDCIKSPKEYNEWREEDRLVGLAVRGYNEWVIDIQHYLVYNGYDETWANWRVFGNWVSVFKEVFPNEPYFLNNGEEYRLEIGAIYEQHRDKAEELWKEYEKSKDCAEEHELHHIKAIYNTIDELEDLLGFNDDYKEWVEIIRIGFDEIEQESE